MSVKIRLQRHGRKKKAFYHIVVADSRSPRDGRFIEKLGTYDPYHQEAKVSINFDSALGWIQKGAEPSDTCRVLLSAEGVMYKNHLLRGVAKGALTEADAEKKFNDWATGKDKRVSDRAQRKTDKRDQQIKAKADAKAKAEAEAAKEAEAAAAPAPAEEASPAEGAPAAEGEAPAES